MSYTDQDVERVAEALYQLEPDYHLTMGRTILKSWQDARGDYKALARKRARAALEAMAREPLEDALDAIGGYVSEVGRNPGHTEGWQAVVVKEPYQHFGTGATIDEAIRAALDAAKGEEA